ncbi:MAG: hypothetical protein VXV91_07755, partial [Verrucomicrobiota bacterium]|nr:hypothetical protein [Verrucomicrobiota bacterium]MEC7236130.1 hypothetical protein [Verrucomicrobiota bacterium]
EPIENMSLEERATVLEEWNDKRRKRHLNIVTDDPSRPFSHLTAIPGGGDAEKYSTGSYPGYFDRDQLYYLGNDPKEQINLADNPKYAKQLAAMKVQLRKHLNVLPGGFGDLK